MTLDRDEIVERLYCEYATTIQRLCFLYLGNVGASEDALQETFIKVYQKYHSFQGKSEQKTWLTRIAINTCKDILRKRQREEILCVEEQKEIENYHTRTCDITCEKLMVTTAIQELPRELKEVVILYYYQELSTKEIANILRIPRTTVEFRLKKARMELKVKIKEEYLYE